MWLFPTWTGLASSDIPEMVGRPHPLLECRCERRSYTPYGIRCISALLAHRDNTCEHVCEGRRCSADCHYMPEINLYVRTDKCSVNAFCRISTGGNHNDALWYARAHKEQRNYGRVNSEKSPHVCPPTASRDRYAAPVAQRHQARLRTQVRPPAALNAGGSSNLGRARLGNASRFSDRGAGAAGTITWLAQKSGARFRKPPICDN